MTEFERKLATAAEHTSGYFTVMPVIRDNFQGPRYDEGYPELYPSFKQLDSGEVVVDAHKEPPEGVVLPATPTPRAAE
jgi:hypothetical protein